jgi:AcrR family transcriptional regulator
MEKLVAPSGAATTPPAPRRGRPPRLSAEEIVDTGLALLRAEGMQAVTFRRLAEELDVTPMSLYGYFGSKDELLGGMTARVIEAPAESLDATLPWDTALSIVMRRLHATLVAHPGIAELVSSRAVPGPSLDPTSEHLAAILRSAGLDERETVDTLYVLLQQVIGAVMVETRRPPAGVAEEAARHRALAREQYPTLVEISNEYARGGSVHSFEFALQLLIKGLLYMIDSR